MRSEELVERLRVRRSQLFDRRLVLGGGMSIELGCRQPLVAQNRLQSRDFAPELDEYPIQLLGSFGLGCKSPEPYEAAAKFVILAEQQPDPGGQSPASVDR